MTTAEVLQKARDLIADESRWTHGYYAKDAQGFSVEPNEEGACCWCALGAVLHVQGLDTDFEASNDATCALTDAVGDKGSVPFINDQEGHAAVLALFDEAIAAEAA